MHHEKESQTDSEDCFEVGCAQQSAREDICNFRLKYMPISLAPVDISAWMSIACILAWVRRATDLKEGVVRYEGISIMPIAT